MWTRTTGRSWLRPPLRTAAGGPSQQAGQGQEEPQAGQLQRRRPGGPRYHRGGRGQLLGGGGVIGWGAWSGAKSTVSRECWTRYHSDKENRNGN